MNTDNTAKFYTCPTCDRQFMTPTAQAVHILRCSTTQAGEAPAKFTSKRIQYLADGFGQSDDTHIEIKWGENAVLQMDISDSSISLVGPLMHPETQASNAVVIQRGKGPTPAPATSTDYPAIVLQFVNGHLVTCDIAKDKDHLEFIQSFPSNEGSTVIPLSLILKAEKMREVVQAQAMLAADLACYCQDIDRNLRSGAALLDLKNKAVALNDKARAALA